MRVFRVEHKHDNVGPFNTVGWGGSYREIFGHKHDSHLYPAIYSEELKEQDWTNYRVACQTPCLLLDWFGEFLPDIINDCNVWVIEVEDDKVMIGASQRQCAYYPEGEIKRTRLYEKIQK
jgi:hypothetical protein